ncbi:MAG: hypothetical protein IJM23_00810 [Lachnospiraceae bacterium]|nr:hypothetical protein [Lachnospiraceae bacterium]
MMKMTSAHANKMLRKLNEDKEFWRSKEKEGCFYTASLNEDPVIPEYDYSEVAKNISEIDAKILKIKHAINVSNCTNMIQVGDAQMTVDMILVKMAQLNRRKSILDGMRKKQPKTRVGVAYYSSRSTPEYEYINYDINIVKGEYEQIDAQISVMQIALDKYNQTVEFEVEI